jgi:hypothetical protein
VLGVERAGDLERAQPRAVWSVGGELLELVQRARGDDLSGAVDVRGGETVRGELREDLVLVAAAAVISPTEWPAPAATTPNASAGCGKSSSRDTMPAATSSDWATAVSRIVSASASVP